MATPNDSSSHRSVATPRGPLTPRPDRVQPDTKWTGTTQVGSPVKSPVQLAIGPRGYPEYGPGCSNVVRGGFEKNNLTFDTISLRCFPPPSNEDYDRALHADHFTNNRNSMSPTKPDSGPLLHEDALAKHIHIVASKDENGKMVIDRVEHRRSSLVPTIRATSPISDLEPTSEEEDGDYVVDEDGVDSLDEEDEADWVDARAEAPRVETEEKVKSERGGIAGGNAGGNASENAGWPTRVSSRIQKRDPSPGEILARSINFKRAAWVTTDPGVSGDIYPPEEQREDFIKNIDTHGLQLDYCNKCNKKHIPPGSPITLADRDTCGSLLPAWFPAHLVVRPWDAFRALINEIVELDERIQNDRYLDRDPDRPVWDLEWHEANEAWKAAGRREGWWKCQSGPDAPLIERECNACHRERPAGQQRLTLGEERQKRAERRRDLQGFIDENIRHWREKDMEAALKHIRAHGVAIDMFGPRPLRGAHAHAYTDSDSSGSYSSDSESYTPERWVPRRAVD